MLVKELSVYKCNKCDQSKAFSEFYKSSTTKTGIRGYCKVCCSNNNKENYIVNSEKIKKLSNEYYHNNKGRIKKDRKVYHKEYSSREEVKIRRRENERIRYHNDIRFRVSSKFRRSILHSLKDHKEGKRWEILVGFTITDLVNHLTIMIDKVPNMNWQDFLDGELQLDHIRPISSFNYTSYTDSDFKNCWKLTNLQLLLAKDNTRKLDKYDGTEENRSLNLNFISYDDLLENINNFN